MNLVEIKNKVTPILQEYGIKKASVFGSFSREENRSDSDVDLLVELGKPLGLFAYSKLIRLMEESLGHRVDLVTNKSLNRFVRPYVLPELKIIYEG
ncbi:MAG: nucleotidyltransferase domain-containing protein [Patescibacteria group bacterium]